MSSKIIFVAIAASFFVGGAKSSENISLSLSSTCPDLILYTYLENSAIYIIRQSEILKKADIKTRQALESQLTEQTQLFVRLNKTVEYFLDTHENSSCLPDQFKDKLLQKRKRARHIIDLLQASSKQRGEGIVKLIVAQIHEGEFDSARAEFVNLGDDDEIAREFYVERIVKLAYDNNLKNFDNLRRFLWRIPLCTQVATGLQVLYARMRATGQLDKSEVLMLTGETTTCESVLTDLASLVQPYQNAILEEWAIQIRAGEFGEIYAYLNRFGVRLSDNGILNHHITNLIKMVYAGNPANFEEVLAFLKSPPWISTAFFGYSSLYNEMKEGGHHCTVEMFRLVKAINGAAIENNDSVAGDATELRGMFSTLLNSIPNVFRKVVASGEVASQVKCTIKNERWNENLFLSTASYRDYREVMTYMKDNGTNRTKVDAYWKFKGVDEDYLSFHIVNVFYKDFPYLTQNKKSKGNAERINVIGSTLPTGSTSEVLEEMLKYTWRLEPFSVDAGGETMTINLINDFGNFYLFAPQDTVEEGWIGRSVFTFAKRMTPPAKEWMITCYENET